MFEAIVIPILERWAGKKLSVLIADGSRGSVSERTIRNWMHGKEPASGRLDALCEASKNWLEDRLTAYGVPDNYIETYVQAIGRSRGVLGAMLEAMNLESDGKCPRSVALARQLDSLSADLRLHFHARDLPAFLASLHGAGWLLDEYFVDFEIPAPESEPRRWLNEADTWEQCMRPVAVLLCNLLFHLLATLDLEFCASYFSAFEASPLFLRLMPKTKLSTEPRTPRDNRHLPVRRLLALSACLRYWKTNRRWPRSAPSVKVASIWMGVSSEVLTNWRRGRQFTFNDYAALWDRMFKDLDTESRPALPTPLLFATTVFTVLYVKGRSERGDLVFRRPEPGYACYLKWWELERARAGNAVHFGGRAWMSEII